MPRKSPPSDRAPRSAEGPSDRLQKALAAAGIGSRRECEELILAGRVEVDRHVVQELGTRVDPARQEIRVDGVVLPRPKLAYYAVNKPVGVVSTNRDPSGRPRVIDLVKSEERLFTIGRLDRTSEGLILVTNDGELANLLTHPRYGVSKVYRAHVAGHPAPELLKKLERGIHLSDGVCRVASARVRRRLRDGSELEIVLNEGRNREIRRILARIGHKVLRLKRIAIGPVQLEDMPAGTHRRLRPDEVRALRESCDATRRAARQERRRPAKRRPAGPKQRPEGKGGPKPASGRTAARRPPRAPLGQARPGAVLSYDDDAIETPESKPRSARRRPGRKQP